MPKAAARGTAATAPASEEVVRSSPPGNAIVSSKPSSRTVVVARAQAPAPKGKAKERKQNVVGSSRRCPHEGCDHQTSSSKDLLVHYAACSPHLSRFCHFCAEDFTSFDGFSVTSASEAGTGDAAAGFEHGWREHLKQCAREYHANEAKQVPGLASDAATEQSASKTKSTLVEVRNPFPNTASVVTFCYRPICIYAGTMSKRAVFHTRVHCARHVQTHFLEGAYAPVGDEDAQIWQW